MLISWIRDSKGYLGIGRSASFQLYEDFWEYDPSNDTWTRKADFPGGPRYAAVGFGIGNKGYIGTGVGYPLYTFQNDFWEYDPATNLWTRKADFGGSAKELAVGFNIGCKGYIGTGSYTADFWEYDPLSNTWAQKANFSSGRNMATGFSIGDKGYLGTGAIFYFQNDLWAYTPSTYIACITNSSRKYVNNNSTLGDVFTSDIGNDANPGTAAAPFATLAYALAHCTPGDSIFVDAGNYPTPNLTIDRSITILGPNYLIDPNNAVNDLLPNLARNAESVISGSTFTIGANDINLEGLSLDPGDKSAIVLSNTSFGNMKFSRNKCILKHSNYILLNGTVVAPPTIPPASGYIFAKNRFEKQNTTSAVTFFLNSLNDVTIEQNSFVVTGSTPRTQTVAFVGSSGLVENFRFINNTIDKANNVAFTQLISHATFSGNKCYNTLNGLFIQGTYQGSCDIIIEDNLIEHSNTGSNIIVCRLFNGNLPASTNQVLIQNNTININGTGLNSLAPAINTQISTPVLSPSLVINGNKVSHSGNYNGFSSSAAVIGISLNGKNANTTVTNNEVAFSGTNLIAPNPLTPSALVASGMLLSTDPAGNPTPAGSNIFIQNNKFAGYYQSVALYDGNNFAPNTFTGYGTLAAGVNVSINDNSFTGDLLSINNGTTGQPVNATCNWYNTASAAQVLSKITLPTVNFIPWLTSGTDANAATGFQPTPGTCNGGVLVITCPPDKQAATSAGSCSAIVDLDQPGFNDNNLVTSVTNDAPAQFPVGTTVVTWTIIDFMNTTHSCSQAVTVEDLTAPVINCNPDITVPNSPGLCTATVSLVPPTLSDNCNGNGNALSFDGGYGSVPDNPLLNPYDEWTIECWAKKAANSYQESLIEKYYFGSVYGYLLRFTNDKVMAGVLHGSFAGTFITGTTSIVNGDWYHLAATYNRATATLKLYVNGNLEATATGITNIPTVPNPTSLKLGARGDDINTRLTAGSLMDEVRIWSTERSQSEIQGSMNQELNNGTGLVAAYHFNQGIPGGNNPGLTTIIDGSVNGLNGVLTDFALTGPTSNWVEGRFSGLTKTNNAPAIYPMGNTTVTWVATDAAGNTSSCQQIVTVQDTESPVAICKNITVTLAGGSVSITAGDINNGSTDNCGISEMTLSTSSFNCSNTGPNTVTFTVKDAAGNSNSCNAIVTVVGSPVTCSVTAVPSNNIYTGGVPTNIYLGYGPQAVTLEASAVGGTEFTYAWSGSGLSCTNCSSPVFTPTLPGSYDFTVTITNEYGCQATCTITICVLDIRVSGTDGSKVYVCHAAGNSPNHVSLAIPINTVQAHVPSHSGDHLGTCDMVPCQQLRGPLLITQNNAVITTRDKEERWLGLQVFPNPGAVDFSVIINTGESNKEDKIGLRILNTYGQVIETRINVIQGHLFKIGENYKPGIYFLELIQGNERKTMKLIKLDK